MDEKINEYLEYAKKVGDRRKLYKNVSERYGIRRAVYPGSHVDITPSLYIPDVTYIDTFKGSVKFFREIASIHKYISIHKNYTEECKITFIGRNYEERLDIPKAEMIISQYAGFVGHATKRYLKDNGILLCNDSHGDATLAYFDDDYEFIGVVNSNYEIVETGLNKYFNFAKPAEIDINKVRNTMKGPKYKYRPGNYLFKLKPRSPINDL